MNTRFRLTAQFPRKLEELGVRTADVLRLAGLPTGLFAQDRILVSTEELFALYRGLAEATRDPAIALKLGTEHRIERYDPVAIAAVCARTFRDALARLGRFKQLHCPEDLRVTERGAEARVEFKYLLARETEPPLLVDIALSWVAGIAHRGSDGAILPRRIELMAKAGDRAMYETHLGCPVTFGARQNALVFRREDLDRPFLTHNADLLAMLAPQLEAELKQTLAAGSLRTQVRAVLKPLLAGRRPGIADVARELGLSARTLQRRLAEDGTSFQQLVQEARRELARHYLQHSALELTETAYLLGYEDSHSFFRAFQQWEGQTPGEWRARRARQADARIVARTV